LLIALRAALASENKCKVLTGNPEFKKLENEIEIEWLSKKETKIGLFL
jgi:hypothetical protein